MTRIFAGIIAVFFSVSVWAQDEETKTLPFEIDLKKSIIVESTTTQTQGAFIGVFKDTTRLTPKKRQDDMVIFEAETIEAEMVSVEGVPPFLTELLENVTADAKGLKFQYAADATGYPTKLTKYKKISSFMKKMGRGLKKWAKKFGKSKGLNDQQFAVMNGFIDQSIAPFMSDDPEKLALVVLEQPQMMFFATGRELYVDYYTELKGTRYFKEGQAHFYKLIAGSW